MADYDPLKSLFLRYRKRKQISLDGHTPGLEYQRRHRDDSHTPPTGHAAQRSHGGDYLAGQDPAQYDPGRAFYSSHSTPYDRPTPRDEPHI